MTGWHACGSLAPSVSRHPRTRDAMGCRCRDLRSSNSTPSHGGSTVRSVDRQALALGFTDSTIRRRVGTGRWLRLDDGVYALASHPFTWRRQCMAATLAMPSGVISGRAAAVLHALPSFQPGAVELLVPRVGRGTRTRLAVVRSAASVRRVTIDHIPCLPLADTVVRLLNRISPAELAAVVDHVLVARLANDRRRCRTGSSNVCRGARRAVVSFENCSSPEVNRASYRRRRSSSDGCG